MEIIAEEKETDPTLHSHSHLPMQSQIGLMFMAVMLLFAVFASLLNSLIITSNFEDELDEKAGQYIQFIFKGYLENIKDTNRQGFQSSLRKILYDKDILSISLYGKNKELILELGNSNVIQDSILEQSNADELLMITQGDIRYYRYIVPSAYKNQIPIGGENKLNYILLGLDGEMVFRTALNAFVWTFLLTISAAICMMFIAVVVIRNFTKPFDRLSSAMESAQLGMRGVRVVPDGASEIYSMGMAFNSMISVLERREDGLLTQKKALEDEIKDRELAELALKNSTSRLQAIFQNAVDGIIVVDKDYKIVSINPSAVMIYGYSEEELIGKYFSEIMQDRFIRLVFVACKEDVSIIRDGGYKALAFTKSGSEVPVEIGVSLMPLSGRDNYLVIVRDISERIKAEKELNNYQLHLEAMVKEQTKDIADSRDAAMAGEKAMSVFLSNMSHELRTPIHGVLSYASIALRKLDAVSTEKTRGYLNEIKMSGEHLLDIINDLLDLSKMKAGKMVYHHLEKSFVNIIENMNREMSGLAKDKRIEFDFIIQGEAVNFYFDEKRMMQVLRNLYANAIKFSLAGVSIKIFADFINPEKFTFSIFNFGVCVPDDECLIIFDSFSQSSKTVTNAGGTGLGLPICKEIVESGHAGKIWSEKGVKEGAKFLVDIPVRTSRTGHTHNKEGSRSGAETL